MMGGVTVIPAVPEDITTIPLAGQRVRWDRTNADALKSVAGDRWRGVTGDDAWVLGMSGRLVRIRPGWVLVRLAAAGGEPYISVTTPEVAALQWQAA